jgi:hypothetical protein
MDSIPTYLSTADAEEITELLKQACRLLRVAADGDYSPNYSDLKVKITQVLERFGIEAP